VFNETIEPPSHSRPALSKTHDSCHHGLQQLSLREEYPTHKGLQGSFKVYTGTQISLVRDAGKPIAPQPRRLISLSLSRTIHRTTASRSKKTLTRSTTTVSLAEPLLLGKSPLDNPKRPHPSPRDRIPVRSCSFIRRHCHLDARITLRCSSSSIALSIYLLSSVILCINQPVFLVFRLASADHPRNFQCFTHTHHGSLHRGSLSTDRPKLRFSPILVVPFGDHERWW